MDKQYYWGTDLRSGEKSLFLVDSVLDGLKVNVYVVRQSQITENFYREVKERWKTGNGRIDLPPHDHIIWDLELSPVMPEFSGINRPEDRDRLSRSAKRALTRQYSVAHAGILRSEIERLEFESSRQKEYSYDLDEVSKLWDRALLFRRRAKEAREKFGSDSGNDWREQISPEDFAVFSATLDSIFTHLKSVRDKAAEKRRKSQNETDKVLNREFSDIERAANSSNEWNAVRDSLKAFREKLKVADLSRDQRQSLFAKVDSAFDTVGKRQSEARNEYDRQCRENFARKSSEASSLETKAANSTDWNEVREELKAFRPSLSGLKLKKDDREALNRKIDSAFERLGTRQSAARNEYENACSLSVYVLEPKLSRCHNLAVGSTDWKDSREEFKSVAEEIRTRVLKKDQRARFREKIDWCFKKLSERQDADRSRYERECSDNYSRLSSRLSRALDSINFAEDFRPVRSELMEIRDSIKESKLTKEQRSELFDTLSARFDRLNARQTQYFEMRNREREERRSEALRGMREQRDRLESSIRHDEGVVSDKESKISSLREGGRYYEIRDGLRASIESINEKIRSKRNRLDDLNAKIRSIENDR